MEGKVIVAAEFPRRLEQHARIAAALEGVSRSELIRRAVNIYIEELGIAGLIATSWRNSKAGGQAEGEVAP